MRHSLFCLLVLACQARATNEPAAPAAKATAMAQGRAVAETTPTSAASNAEESPLAAPEAACGANCGSASDLPARGKLGKFGAPLGAAPAVQLASVLGKPGEYAGKSLRVEGHVRRACTRMGCWLELAESGADDAPACRVIMKDHAFFVPTDAAGAEARVEGTLDVKRIAPEQVAHFESEGASFPSKAADGSAQEVRFVASGVELWRAGT
jgi:hypothetical protein